MSTRSRRRAARAQEARRVIPPAMSVEAGLGQGSGQSGGFRVLFLGDTAGTGFGTVTRDLASAMVRRGMDVRVLSMNEDAGFHVDPHWPEVLKPRTIMMGIPDGWAGIGGEVAKGIVGKALGIFSGLTIPGWRPQAVLVVGDHSSLDQSPWPKLIPADIPAFHYVPIEGVELPPSWGKLWQRFHPIAMTRFGADEIAKVTGGEAPPVVYHGIDPEAFWPISDQRPLVLRMPKGKRAVLRNKLEARAFLGWPLTATILFRADRLMPRKTYPAMFRAVAPVLARHPEACLVLHCRTVDQGGSLWHETSKYPDFIRDRFIATGLHDRHGGVPRELLTAMYNAADLYVSTSAEGFGLTVAEALACGTPAVALGYSSLPEVVGPAGILVDEYALIDNIYSYFWATPKGRGYEQAVERLVTDRDERERLGKLGPSHVARFDWGVAAEQMDAILQGADAPDPEVPMERRLAALGLVGGRA